MPLKLVLGGASSLRAPHPLQPGVQLHFVEMGQGPPICLCHGFPEVWLSWRYQVGTCRDLGPPHHGHGGGFVPLLPPPVPACPWGCPFSARPPLDPRAG